MKKTQIQQQQYIAGMLKDAPRADEVSYYQDFVNVFDAERLMRERDCQNQPQYIVDELNRLSTESWKVVWQRVKCHVNGGKAYQSISKRGTKKQISKAKYNSLPENEKRKWSAIIRNASGVSVEAQRLYDMFLAARAAFKGGWVIPLTGKEIEPGIKAASAACAYEMRRGLQLPLFEDVIKAQRWNDKAWEIHLQSMAEVSQNVDTERLPERSQIAKKLREHRNAIASHWKSKATKRWKTGRNSQYKLLREMIANASAGVVCIHKKDSAKHKSTQRLLQVLDIKLLATDMQDLERKEIRRNPMPQNTLRVWRSSGAKFVDYVQPASQPVANQELVEIPTGFRHLAHLRK
jgi:hypothetical protein